MWSDTGQSNLSKDLSLGFFRPHCASLGRKNPKFDSAESLRSCALAVDGPTRLFLDNSNLAEWSGHQERLAYYRGHREGRRVREMQEHGDST